MRKIVVVDDTALVRAFVREVLETQGYEVIEASNGREGLTRIEETRPDLVLMDIRMPIQDGLAALRQLRQDPRFVGLPVLAFSAHALEENREKILAAGFDGYITKPVNANTLRTQIEPFLRK